MNDGQIGFEADRDPAAGRGGWSKWLNVARAPKPALFGRDVEGVLAAARCILAAIFVLVLRFGDESADLRLLAATFVYFVLGLFSIACAASLRRMRPALLILTMDVFYGAAVLMGGGSPVLFGMLYTFAVLSGAALLGWRGAVAVGFAMGLLYGAVVLVGVVPHEHLLLRSLYMAGTGSLVARAAFDWEIARARLYRLARWSGGRFDPSDDAVRAVLRHAADILEAEGIVVIWRETGRAEPRQALYRRGADEVCFDRGVHFEAATPAVVRGRPFVLIERRRQICLTYDGPQPAPGAVPAAFLDLATSGDVVASDAFAGRLCQGRLFAFGVRSWRWDQLILVELVAKQVMARLEGRTIREREAHHAAIRERVNVARDLHDGIMQSLTAARLMLRLAGDLPPPARAAIAETSGLLREEQRRLRRFVEARRLDESEAEDALASLGQTISEAAARWRLPVAVNVLTPEATLPASLLRELSFLVVEAVANASRHGGVGVFEATLEVSDRVLSLRLANPAGPDRSGFVGAPRSMSDRVLTLCGTLAVETEATRIVFLIQVPVG